MKHIATKNWNRMALVILTLIGVVACGDKAPKDDRQWMRPDFETQQQKDARDAAQGEAGTEIPQKPSPDQNSSPDFTLNKNYYGKNLVLVYPHTANWGAIEIKDEDARALFESLQIKITEENGNTTWLPAKVKAGTHITCYEQAPRENPESPKYSCSAYIDYRAGLVKVRNQQIEIDSTVADLNSTYLGDSLMMVAPSPNKSGLIQLKGEDAMALYASLSAAPTGTVGNQRKRGFNITCVEQTRSATCSIYLNYSTGAIN